MRRHRVMDIFHRDEKTPVGEWSTKKPDIDGKAIKVFVKLDDNSETFAYYYADKPEGFYFWCCKTEEPLSVIMWKKVKNNE